MIDAINGLWAALCELSMESHSIPLEGSQAEVSKLVVELLQENIP
jgi:hypothetical protein